MKKKKILFFSLFRILLAFKTLDENLAQSPKGAVLGAAQIRLFENRLLITRFAELGSTTKVAQSLKFSQTLNAPQTHPMALPDNSPPKTYI